MVFRHAKGALRSAARPDNHILHETGTGGDLIVEHDEVQLVAALGGQQHAAGLLPHHFARGQVRHGDERLAEQLLGLIILGDAGEDLARRAGAVVQRKLCLLYTSPSPRDM